VIIIIEGPDGTGKTTLAKWIAANQDGFYFHCDGNVPIFGAMREYMTNILDNIEWNLKYNSVIKNYVFDRFWPSEWVHAPILRPHNPIDWILDIDLRMEKLGTVYVMCACDVASRTYEQSEASQKPYTIMTYENITKGYKQLRDYMQKSTQMVVDYDRTKHTEHAIWNQIQEIIR
jgi:thymidylate kinase